MGSESHPKSVARYLHEGVPLAQRYTLRMTTAGDQASDLTVDIESADKAFGEVRDHGMWLLESVPQNSWFAPLLVHLIQSTLREYQHLKIGYAKSIPFLAWACRNMLELNIITQHVLKSESDAKDFIDDRFTDGLELFESSRAGRSSPTPDPKPLRLTKLSRGFAGKSRRKV
jgi:hypothetical protein